MKKILIPTDFTVESLQLIEYSILNFPNEKFEPILVCGYKLPDSRWGLAHFSTRSVVREFAGSDFLDALRVLVREHGNVIGDVRIELFTGKNSFAFMNFIETLEVDEGIFPTDKFLKFKHVKFFDPSPLIKKNIPGAIEIDLAMERMEEKEHFSILSLINS